MPDWVPATGHALRHAGIHFDAIRLPPQTAAGYVWPAGARALSRQAGALAFVGVPAVAGETYPLGWRSLPTREVPFVEVELLQEMVTRAASTLLRPYRLGTFTTRTGQESGEGSSC